jgi:hypothetical protein
MLLGRSTELKSAAGSPLYRRETTWIVALGLFALALILRFWRLPDQLFIYVDDAWHIVIVQRFAREDILDYSQARPMYPYLVGLMSRLVDSSPYFPAQVSAVSGALLALIVVLWTGVRAGSLAGAGAGVLVCLSQIEIFLSKTSGPIAPAMLLATAAYILVWSALSRLATRAWPASHPTALILAAGVLGSLSMTMHRAFLPVPFFIAAFLALFAVRPGYRRALVLVPTFVLATLLPVLIAQIVTERHQPPDINNFGYLNQLKAAFDQQNNWRSGPGGGGWLFYFTGFLQTEGLLAAVLAAHGVWLGAWRWYRERDWWCGLLLFLTAAIFGYSSIVSAAGGITVLRSVAPALPLVSILSGLALVKWCETSTWWLAQRNVDQRFTVNALLLTVIAFTEVALAWPVISAQTGFSRAIDMVRSSSGFPAAYDGDPWRVLSAPVPTILIGPKRSERPPGEVARDEALVSGPCILVLEHFVAEDGLLKLPGLVDLSVDELGTPLAVYQNDRDALTPNRVEFGDTPWENELRTYLEPPPCRQINRSRST